ncbi:hypothetical protein WR25_01675 [Diploscapter pachys]|uniref:Uncharacterized protein n=1 Tax=Diploscapter pachys TaxID=2018661 RepID=A0A2A2JSE9_9BILA|nr:hypothetical protein WR25_01675 [Diploscapter pachys]
MKKGRLRGRRGMARDRIDVFFFQAGLKVLDTPTHVALPQSDTQQKARHDLIAQSASACTTQKFKQQQQTAPQTQAASQVTFFPLYNHLESHISTFNSEQL